MTRLFERLGVLLVICIALAGTTAVATAHQPAATDDFGAVDGSVASVAQEGIVIDNASFDANDGPHVLVEGEVTVDDGYEFFPDSNTVQIGQHGTFTASQDGPELAVSNIDTGEYTGITVDALPTSVTIDLANAQEITIDGAFDALEYRDVGVDDGQRDVTYSASAQSTLTVTDLPTGVTLEAVDASSGETLATADTGSNGVAAFALPAGQHDVVVQTAEDVDPVTVSLEDVEAAPDSTATVTLSTDNVDDLAGYEATVEFDPSVVQFESASGVDLDDPVTDVDNEAGTVTLTQSESSPVDGNPNPVLADLTFSVVGEAGTSSELTLSQLNVNNDAENLPTTPDHGSISVVEGGEYAVSIADVSNGEPVRQGESVVVTANVENVGSGAATETVELAADGETVDSTEVSLAGGESTTVELSWQTSEGTSGDHSVTVSSPDDSASATAKVCEAGDVDYSGNVDSLDATLTQRHIAGLDTQEIYPHCGDMNDDGDVGSLDVTMILQKIVG